MRDILVWLGCLERESAYQKRMKSYDRLSDDGCDAGRAIKYLLLLLGASSLGGLAYSARRVEQLSSEPSDHNAMQILDPSVISKDPFHVVLDPSGQRTMAYCGNFDFIFTCCEPVDYNSGQNALFFYGVGCPIADGWVPTNQVGQCHRDTQVYQPGPLPEIGRYYTVFEDCHAAGLVDASPKTVQMQKLYDFRPSQIQFSCEGANISDPEEVFVCCEETIPPHDTLWVNQERAHECIELDGWGRAGHISNCRNYASVYPYGAPTADDYCAARNSSAAFTEPKMYHSPGYAQDQAIVVDCGREGQFVCCKDQVEWSTVQFYKVDDPFASPTAVCAAYRNQAVTYSVESCDLGTLVYGTLSASLGRVCETRAIFQHKPVDAPLNEEVNHSNSSGLARANITVMSNSSAALTGGAKHKALRGGHQPVDGGFVDPPIPAMGV